MRTSAQICCWLAACQLPCLSVTLSCRSVEWTSSAWKWELRQLDRAAVGLTGRLCVTELVHGSTLTATVSQLQSILVLRAADLDFICRQHHSGNGKGLAMRFANDMGGLLADLDTADSDSLVLTLAVAPYCPEELTAVEMDALEQLVHDLPLEFVCQSARESDVFCEACCWVISSRSGRRRPLCWQPKPEWVFQGELKLSVCLA